MGNPYVITRALILPLDPDQPGIEVFRVTCHMLRAFPKQLPAICNLIMNM